MGYENVSHIDGGYGSISNSNLKLFNCLIPLKRIRAYPAPKILYYLQ